MRVSAARFYPGDVDVVLHLRSTSDVADANVYMRGCESAVVHVTMDWRGYRPGEAQMRISCTDPNTEREVNVVLYVKDPIWSSDPPAFTTGGEGDWGRIVEPDELVRYCMRLYDDFVQLRGR
jgi:hypothetical protein